MSNLILLNFSQLSYSYIKVGLNTQCGIELDVRTIRSIVTSLVNKGIFTRSKKSNFYIYNIVDQNVPKNIQNDPSINKNNKEKEEKEEERTPNQSSSYSTQYQQESREVRTNKFYKDAYQRFPRELIRAQEVSQCIDEMCLCYELNAREFERSKPNFKAEVRNRAKIIVQALLNDTAKFAPIELFWGIKCYETQNTAEPTPASVKKACIRSRIENKELTDTLQYTLKLIRNEQAIPDDEQFILRFTKKYSSEIEGLLNAYYSESKDYDVKFNELVLKMAELPERDNLPNYWDMYQNEFKALPINLDIRLLA